MPSENYPGRFRIGQWMYRNRQQHFSGSLVSYRLRMLEEVGCPVDPIRYVDQFWGFQFKMLQRFRRHHPERWPYTEEEYPAGNKLGRWLRDQRIKYTNGTLKKAFRFQLRDLGFPLKPVTHHNELWHRQYQALKKFREQYPDSWPDSGVLFRWCFTQRRKKVTGELSKQKSGLLGRLGFEWSVTGNRWQERLGQLATFIHRNDGKLPKPSGSNESERILANWVAFQRSRHRRGLLEKDRIARLKQLDVGLLPRGKRESRLQN